ncbi:MAG: helix-turn-helix domain-containing protein [Actinobacteria bacterium]|nr:helix-turn-helix domain-containing protein [Actinomycetota bacterium]
MVTDTRKAFLSIAEASARIGVSTSTGYNLAGAGQLPIVEIHGVRRVPTEALDRWLAERTQQALAAVRAS